MFHRVVAMADAVLVSCPGRVCLAGEYLDWILGPSVAAAITLRLRMHLKRVSRNCTCLRVNSGVPLNVSADVPLADIGGYKGGDLDLVQAAVKLALERFGPLRLEITIDSDLPIAVGLASSAAVAVSTIVGIAHIAGVRLSSEAACELAWRAETEELGTGAGRMDFYSCALGGVTYLDSSSGPPDPLIGLRLPPDVRLVIADTQIRRRTQSVSSFVRQRWLERDSGTVEYVRRIGPVVEHMRTLLDMNAPGDAIEFGRLLTKCHDQLRRSLYISTDLLNECVDACVRAGAFGAKLTGSGMGGAVFAIVPLSRLQHVKAALSALPVKVHTADIDSEGVRIEDSRALTPRRD